MENSKDRSTERSFYVKGIAACIKVSTAHVYSAINNQATGEKANKAKRAYSKLSKELPTIVERIIKNA